MISLPQPSTCWGQNHEPSHPLVSLTPFRCSKMSIQAQAMKTHLVFQHSWSRCQTSLPMTNSPVISYQLFLFIFETRPHVALTDFTLGTWPRMALKTADPLASTSQTLGLQVGQHARSDPVLGTETRCQLSPILGPRGRLII